MIGGDNPEDGEVAKACPHEFAQFAKGETRVFNDAGDKFRIPIRHQLVDISRHNFASTPAGPESYWKQYEVTSMNQKSAVTKILRMADDTMDPDDHDKDLKSTNDGELN